MLFRSHNQEGKGRPTHHLGQAYAQLYRVAVDGSGFQALSDEKGCHYSPSSLGSRKTLIYVHTSCHSTIRTIEALDLTHNTRRELVAEHGIEEVVAGDDSPDVYWVQRGVETLQIMTISLKGRQPRELTRLRKQGSPLQLSVLGKGQVAFVYQGKLWLRQSNGKMRALFSGGIRS